MATLTPRPGLRERKAAELKIRLVDLLTEELREKGFHEVSVEDLSDKALISKVTFYRYFPTKDALLWFHDSVWTYRVKAECLLTGLEGVEALRFLFREMARELDRNVNLFAYLFGISSYLLEGKERVELTDAEKLVLHPDGSTLELEINYSTGHFFRTHVERAREAGELRTDLPAETQALLFGALFSGSTMVGLRTAPENPGEVFSVNFEALVGLLAPGAGNG
jgi:AcrR family transcriptional regulator